MPLAIPYLGIPGLLQPGASTNAVSLDIADRLPATSLSLNRYARIVGGVAPAHFFGAYSDTVFPLKGTCDAVVPRHGWQLYDVVSREEILEQIYVAEMEIAEYLGYFVSPTFVLNEITRYTKPYDPLVISSGGRNPRGIEKSIKTKSGLLIGQGQRAVSLIGTATAVGGELVYSDEDGDGFSETATITMATTETSLCELKCYIADTAGDEAWEIRGPRMKYFDGSGNIVFVYHVWNMISPDIDARYPTAESYRALDMSDDSNLVGSVDIYREYIDNTLSSARFFWESDPDVVTYGSVNDVGSLYYQDGVSIIRDPQVGLLVPRMASYDSDTGVWSEDTWGVSREPDIVRVSYYAGDVSQAFLSGRTCDPLKDIYAKAIAYMATARLNKSICSCPGVYKFFENMQTDLALSSDGNSYTTSFGDLENPFGTRRGEIMAWRLIGKLKVERLLSETEIVVI